MKNSPLVPQPSETRWRTKLTPRRLSLSSFLKRKSHKKTHFPSSVCAADCAPAALRLSAVTGSQLLRSLSSLSDAPGSCASCFGRRGKFQKKEEEEVYRFTLTAWLLPSLLSSLLHSVPPFLCHRCRSRRSDSWHAASLSVCLDDENTNQAASRGFPRTHGFGKGGETQWRV